MESQLSLALLQLENERKMNRELVSKNSNTVQDKNELEVFFLECVDELKKDIAKRRELQIKNAKFPNKGTERILSSKS